MKDLINAPEIEGSKTTLHMSVHPSFFNDTLRVVYWKEQKRNWVNRVYDCLIMPDGSSIPDRIREAHLNGHMMAVENEGIFSFEVTEDTEWKAELAEHLNFRNKSCIAIGDRWVSLTTWGSFISYEYKYRRWANERRWTGEGFGYVPARKRAMMYRLRSIREDWVKMLSEEAGIMEQSEISEGSTFLRQLNECASKEWKLMNLPHVDYSDYEIDIDDYINEQISKEFEMYFAEMRAKEKELERYRELEQEYKNVFNNKTKWKVKGSNLHDRYYALHEGRIDSGDRRFEKLNEQCLRVFEQLGWDVASRYTEKILTKGERASWGDLNQVRYYIHLVELGAGHFNADISQFGMPIEVLAKIEEIPEEELQKTLNAVTELKKERAEEARKIYEDNNPNAKR